MLNFVRETFWNRAGANQSEIYNKVKYKLKQHINSTSTHLRMTHSCVNNPCNKIAKIHKSFHLKIEF